MTTHKTVAMRAVSVAILLALSACGSVLPGGGNRVARSNSPQPVGALKFQIVECASGAVIAQGTHEILARDIAITQKRGLGCFDKRIDLDQGFYIQMAECVSNTREEIGGFSITPGRVRYRSSWEWFDVDHESRAVQRQGSGELTITPVAVGSSWEVGRTEVVKDISLRVFGWDPTAIFRNAPRWRIQLKPGSYVEWPSATNGGVVLHSFPVPSPPQ